MIMFARGLIVAALIESSSGFVNPAAARPGAVARLPTPACAVALPRSTVSRGGRSLALGMVEKLGPDETVKKYGLEAGLFKALKDGNKEDADGEAGAATTTAKDLLKQYGSAYLITSISLSLVSFGICYVAVSNGVDMASLLGKVGIETSASAETTGTVAVAYAIHKAASPIRFPPTVALTPAVAKFLGKGDGEETAAAAAGEEGE
ncbi:conserved unknown protein [Ectocarpus siliculosus]|uniref:DUF1279 domain-containing protein n=1 Tax=Ectocarpus siliculosus TaxID=2880 RepID=D7G6X9_ECTSI|nr:conserved unknown protein [Ectocarpus siliculosus]|eukprot:CBJ25672.1 conserved unknown protein [Ectocarpus siliculosus]